MPRRFLRPVPPALLVALLLVAGCRPEAVPVPMDDEARRLVALANGALEEGQYDRALALADSAARRAPDAAEPDFLKGLAFSRTLHWQEAEAAYRRVLARDPLFPGVWNNLGNNAVAQGAYQQALSYYTRELSLRPAPLPWEGMGRVYRELGLVDSAAYAFEQALALDSSHVPAYLSYARLLENEGAYPEALALVEAARRRAPEKPEVVYQLGSLLARVGREAEALPHLEAVARDWPWHTESHYKLGQVLQRLGRHEEGRAMLATAEKLWKHQNEISDYQKSLAQDPDNPFAHAALATAFRMAGRYDEAVRSYHAALALDPANLEFQNNLASLHFLRRDTSAAIQTYRLILEQDPAMVEVWVNLGVLYALTGQAEAARHAWQQALARRPGDPKVQAYLARLDAAR